MANENIIQKTARINTDLKLWEMINELADIQWDIVCFSEARTLTNDIIVSGGNRLISNLGTHEYAGVALLINRRWAKNVLDIGGLPGRTIYADIQIGAQVFRYISVYMPHAGYPLVEFEECIKYISEIVLEGQRKKYKCILGGDFNTEMGRGTRSDIMMELMGEFGLEACNINDNLTVVEQWTFRSSLGRLRRLDYIIAEGSLSSREAGPVDFLDLGSDHRAVMGTFLIQGQKRDISRKKQSYKSVDWNAYNENILDSLGQSGAKSLEELEQLMVESAACARSQNEKRNRISSRFLNDLRRERQETRDNHERMDVSKQI